MKTILVLLVSLAIFCHYSVACANVRINEFIAGNSKGLQDEDGENEDWIELYNTSTSVLNLEGFTLTDDVDDSLKWTFPSVTIEPFGYLIIWASGKNKASPFKELT